MLIVHIYYLRKAQNSTDVKDKEVFLLKYKNAIQELNML